MAATSASQVEQAIMGLVQALTNEGVLDEQFQQLLMLQDESNPDFVAEVVMLYFEGEGRCSPSRGGVASGFCSRDWQTLPPAAAQRERDSPHARARADRRLGRQD